VRKRKKHKTMLLTGLEKEKVSSTASFLFKFNIQEQVAPEAAHTACMLIQTLLNSGPKLILLQVYNNDVQQLGNQFAEL
jgi:hypothetical protein